MGRSYQHKIVSRAGLQDVVSGARSAGRSIVLCHGCFDIVHPGHIRYLEFARKHGDMLVVSITSDATIDKAIDRPYIPEELRAESLAALEFVDIVYIDPHESACDVLETVKPEVYVKGDEYQVSQDPRFLSEQQVVERNGGKVIYSSGDVRFSSTELIERLGRDTDLELRRLGYVCQRHQINHGTLGAVLNRFAGRRVVVVGDVLLDRYLFCDAVDVARESPMMSLRELDERTYLGGAAVVARHLAGLGATVEVVSSFGRDAVSDWVRSELQSDGVVTHSLLERRGLVVKTRYLVEDHKVLKVERGEHCPLDTRAVRQAGAVLLGAATDAGAVVFCDFGYGVITERLLSCWLSEIRRRADVITADVSGNRGTLLSFSDVDLFSPTERELRSTLHDYDQGLSSVAWRLMGATRVRHLIATLGRRGLVAFDRPVQDPASADFSARLRSEYLQALNARASDALGCGDALLAGCSLALCCGASFVQAAYIGNVMAAAEAAEIGNIPVTLRLLRRWLDGRPELQATLPAAVKVS